MAPMILKALSDCIRRFTRGACALPPQAGRIAAAATTASGPIGRGAPFGARADTGKHGAGRVDGRGPDPTYPLESAFTLRIHSERLTMQQTSIAASTMPPACQRRRMAAPAPRHRLLRAGAGRRGLLPPSGQPGARVRAVQPDRLRQGRAQRSQQPLRRLPAASRRGQAALSGPTNWCPAREYGDRQHAHHAVPALPGREVRPAAGLQAVGPAQPALARRQARHARLAATRRTSRSSHEDYGTCASAHHHPRLERWPTTPTASDVGLADVWASAAPATAC